jgi:hypothetical protein
MSHRMLDVAPLPSQSPRHHNSRRGLGTIIAFAATFHGYFSPNLGWRRTAVANQSTAGPKGARMTYQPAPEKRMAPPPWYQLLTQRTGRLLVPHG